MNSVLTVKLLGHLHRIFNKDPDRELALRIAYPSGSLRWTVNDGILSTTVDPLTVLETPLFLDGSWPLDGSYALNGGSGFTSTNLRLDLSLFTLGSLSAHIASQIGYEVLYSPPSEFSSLSALILIDGSGDQSESNGDHLYCYTSLLWSYVSSLSSELSDAKSEISEMLQQMSLQTADGEWLDELGSYYKVARILGESDYSYGPRIVAETLLPKGNNYAIAAAIKKATGLHASVEDCVTLPEEQNYFDGTWFYDGSRKYAVHDSKAMYGLFDVLVQYDLMGDINVQNHLDTISEQVNRLRDAGTYMRQIGVSGASKLSDSADYSVADTALLTVSETWRYDGTVLFNGLATFGGRVISVEDLGGEQFMQVVAYDAQLSTVQTIVDVSWAIDGDYISASSTVMWSLTAPITSTTSLSWLVDGYAVLSASVQVSWLVDGYYSAQQTVQWDVDQYVTLTHQQDTSWSIGTVLTAGQQVVWSIDSPLGLSTPIVWSVSGPVTAVPSIIWSIDEPISSALPVSWQVGMTTSADNIIAWALSGPITLVSPCAWSIGEVASASISNSWSIDSAISSTSTSAWSILN